MKLLTKKKITDFHKMLNMKRDPWQVDVIYQTIKQKEYFLSAPRQIGKTTVASDLALLLAIKGLKVLFLTHRSDNVRDVMNRVLAYARPLAKDGIVTRIAPSHGFTEIDFASGGKITFRVRTAGVSVGLTFDVIIWDEAQKIDPSIVEEVDPILSQSIHKIQLFIGTPPTQDDWRLTPDGPFMRAKIKGGPSWKEFSAADSYSSEIAITKKNALKANPAGYRTPDFWESLLKSAEKMDHESFCRQYLGVWNIPKKIEVNEPYLSDAKIKKMLTTKGSTESKFVASVGISSKTNKAFIAMNDGTTVEIAERFELDMGGLDEVSNWIKDRIRDIRVVRFPSTARGKALAEEMKLSRLTAKTKVVSLPEFSTNLSRFFKQADEGSLKIYKEKDVELALGSFWLGFEPRSGSYDVKSGLPEDAVLVMALVNSVVDAKITERGSGSRGGKAMVF